MPKKDSEKMYSNYMSNLMNYVKINEIMHNQIKSNYFGMNYSSYQNSEDQDEIESDVK